MKINKMRFSVLAVLCLVVFITVTLLSVFYTEWKIPFVVGAGLQLFGTSFLKRFNRIER